MLFTFLIWGLSQGYGTNPGATFQALFIMAAETIRVNYSVGQFPYCLQLVNYMSSIV